MREEGCDAIDVIMLQCVEKDDLETNKDSGRIHCTRYCCHVWFIRWIAAQCNKYISSQLVGNMRSSNLKNVSSAEPRWFPAVTLLADMKTQDETVDAMISNQDGMESNVASRIHTKWSQQMMAECDEGYIMMMLWCKLSDAMSRIIPDYTSSKY